MPNEGVAGREHPGMTKTLRRIHPQGVVRVWEVDGKLYYQGSWQISGIPGPAGKVTVTLGIGYPAALKTVNWLVKSELARRGEDRSLRFKKKEEEGGGGGGPS